MTGLLLGIPPPPDVVNMGWNTGSCWSQIQSGPLWGRVNTILSETLVEVNSSNYKLGRNVLNKRYARNQSVKSIRSLENLLQKKTENTDIHTSILTCRSSANFISSGQKLAIIQGVISDIHGY